MAKKHDTMVKTPVEDLLAQADSKFRLVTLASKRARQINSYYGQLGDGLGAMIPPQVTTVARKPLSIAFEEIAAKKIEVGEYVPEPEPGSEGLGLLPEGDEETSGDSEAG